MNFSSPLFLFLVLFLNYKPTENNHNSFSAHFEKILLKYRQYRDAVVNTATRIRKLGYPLVDYEVETQDGYLITVHRISHGLIEKQLKNNTAIGEPVLILPGMSCSAMIFVRVNDSIGLYLADQGFDVWLGNSRGDLRYSRHTKYTKRDSEFWNFTWEEMGYYDVSSMIDFILKNTNRKNIILVSYSVGTIASFALLSSKQEYNDKLAAHVMLAPMSIVPYQTSILMSLAMMFYDRLHNWYLGSKDIGRINNLLQNHTMYLAPAICLTTGYKFCQFVMALFVGFNPGSYEDTIGIITFDLSSGVSFQTFLHILQQIKYKEFRRFSYGIDENLKRYGTEIPPIFNLEEINSPLTFIHGISDPGSCPLNAELMHRKMPNAKQIMLNFTMFTHNDFVWSADPVLKSYLNEVILENIRDVKTDLN